MVSRNIEQIAKRKKGARDRTGKKVLFRTIITNATPTNNGGQEQHLHMQSDLPALSMNNSTPLNTELTGIAQAARPIFASVITSFGDFENRVSDTRTRKNPTMEDMANINGTIAALTKENNRVQDH